MLRNCLDCNKYFLTYPSKIKMGKGKYCSKECSNKNTLFKRGGNLQADHIKPWVSFPELRYKINNGRTLCIPCHRRTDTYGINAKFISY